MADAGLILCFKFSLITLAVLLPFLFLRFWIDDQTNESFSSPPPHSQEASGCFSLRGKGQEGDEVKKRSVDPFSLSRVSDLLILPSISLACLTFAGFGSGGLWSEASRRH